MRATLKTDPRICSSCSHRQLSAAISSAVLLGAPAAVLAHHSGLYDDSNIVAVDGKITAIAWINPHVRLTLAATAEDGSTSAWEVEGTSINALERWGVEQEWFVVGDTISVKGPQ